MKTMKPIAALLFLIVILVPSISSSAQYSATLENFFGEGSFMDGYDFSAYAVQRWGESGPDNPNLTPDFYLGDSNTPVTTPEYHSPKATIDYGTTPISAISEVPSQSDPRFGSHAFIQGHTYGLFTNEGDYVVLNVMNIYTQPYGDYHKNGVVFQWVTVVAGPTGTLSLSLYPYDKPEFALGDNPTIGGDVLVGGQPLPNASVCPEVVGDAGQFMFAACFTTDANGQFSFRLEYGVNIPEGYRGNLVVWANVVYENQVVEQTIYVPYGAQALDLPLNLDLVGPIQPILIGSYDYIEIGGTLTSNTALVDGADILIEVNGQSFWTTTGLYDPGKFYWSWENNAFPAGVHTVKVTASITGYQSASKQLTFTLVGEGYDFWVTMDTIPAVLAPGNQVSFPGTLTLGGKPASDWVEVDITFPNGRVNTYMYQTGMDGRFNHVQPSLNELGTYKLAIYHHPDRKLISQVITFAVGEASTPTPTAEPTPEPTPQPKVWELIEIQYPPQPEVGDTIQVTGKLVYKQGDQILSQEGLTIWAAGVVNNYRTINQSGYVKTAEDGSFTLDLPLESIDIDTLVVLAQEQEDSDARLAYWFGPLLVILPLEPSLELNQTVYDQGEIVEGILRLQPASTPQGWNAGLKIFYQVVGPIGGAEMMYFFEAEPPQTEPTGRFYWQVPTMSEAGTYRVTAYISGLHLPSFEVQAEFDVNDIRATTLTAMLETSSDGWTSADLVGLYTDFEGAPIPDADIRVNFFETVEPHREFNLNGTAGPDGRFRINLEPLDKFAAQGKEDPWENRRWVTTVYADKEGYATGATIIDILTPTIEPHLEIIEIDPPLDFLSQKAEAGLSYKELLDMNITVKVRYNNIFENGAKLNIGASGNWAVYCPQANDPAQSSIRKAYLAVNGDEMPEWDQHDYGMKYENMSFYLGPGYAFGYAYYAPSHSTTMTALTGLRQESQFTVSGKLFGYRYDDGSPNPCGGSAYGSQQPEIPPGWLQENSSAVRIYASLGSARAEARYNLTPPGISGGGTAWVSANGGKLDLTLGIGTASGYKLPNSPVQLSIIAKDILLDEEIPYDQITVQSSATTDAEGKISLPLTAKTNPCELKDLASYFVKVTSNDLQGERLVPIELRCAPLLNFKIDDNNLILVQALELPQDQPYRLAAGKEAGVRVYLEVGGEIYQPENTPASINIKAELLQPGTDRPLVPQTKTVSLTQKGASVRWTDSARAVNQAGIGEVAKWNNTPTSLVGNETVPIDFVFTPRSPSSSNGVFEIRITVDPSETYGQKLEQSIQGVVHKMKTLRLVFVPVDIYALDTNFIFQQANFLLETYPLGMSNLVMELGDIYTTDQLPKTCISMTYLKRIACGLGSVYGSGGDTNSPTRIVGIVESSTWLNESYVIMKAAGIDSAIGAYAPELWDSTTNNVVLVRYPENVVNTTAHEVGHSYGLEPKEQYKTNPEHGLPVHGHVLRDSKIYDIPGDWDDLSNAGWKKGTSFSGSSEIYDLMGNPGYQINEDDDSFTEILSQKPWIVYKTWNSLFDVLADPPGDHIFSFQGVISEGGSASLTPMTLMQGVPDDINQGGDYQFQIQSSSGEVLYSHFFGLNGATSFFQVRTPYTPGFARVVLLQGETLLTEMVRSLNSPEVSFLPLPDETSPENRISISWTGTDLDGEDLSYSLSYRCEESLTWMPLVANLNATSYLLDLSRLPGGSCLFKLVASDGLNVSEATSDLFSAPPNGPQVQILTEEATYPARETLLLQGLAADLSDGILHDESLSWSSDRDGALGYGHSIQVNLSTGRHTITLLAQDSDGNISLAQTVFEIADDAILPDQPTPTSLAEETLSGEVEKSNRQGFILIAALALAGFMLVGAILLTIWALRRRSKSIPVPVVPNRQPGVVRDNQGNYWYQDPQTRTWYYWNGRAWQVAPQPPPGKRLR